MEEKPVIKQRTGWEGFAALACVVAYFGLQLTLALKEPMFRTFPLHLLEVISPSAQTNDWTDPSFHYLRSGGNQVIFFCILLVLLLCSTFVLAYSAKHNWI